MAIIYNSIVENCYFRPFEKTNLMEVSFATELGLDGVGALKLRNIMM